MRGFGGHIKELAVGGTCEVFLHTLQTDQKLERAHDKNIGLPLLRLHENS
jgi:predicted DNA-binding protein with PD1-like motif